jgi:hypothetical protein
MFRFIVSLLCLVFLSIVGNSEPVAIGSRVLTVTTLSDSGAGSLRAALSQPGPRIIVFEVAGYIKLLSDLPITSGNVVVAGETAPSPGIVITGGTVQIRTSNVQLRHIAVYAGASTNPAIAENRDAINIYGSAGKNNRISDVVLSHVTAAWGVDENIGLNGLVDGVRIEHSMIGQGLWRGGHPKGIHSMNMLFGNTIQRVDILGSIFAASNQRSPRLTSGNKVAMLNNFIYDWGLLATHIDTSVDIINAGAISIIGNDFQPGTASGCARSVINISKDFFDRIPLTSVYLKDNILKTPNPACHRLFDPKLEPRFSREPGPLPADWSLKPAESVFPAILDTAGARPKDRNPLDQRLINAIKLGTLKMVDNETSAGGWPAVSAGVRKLTPPVLVVANQQDRITLISWLCGKEKAVGGPSQLCR